MKHSGQRTHPIHNQLKHWLVWLCLLFLPLTLAAETNQSATITVYHYNPESYSGRSLVLKSTFDRYFETSKLLQMQPVEEKQTFHNVVIEQKPHLYIVSDWDFQQLKKLNPNITPYLRGKKNGDSYFLKYLVSSTNKNTNNLLRPTLAISGSKEYTQFILNSMNYQDGASPLKNPRHLPVPKDIDALLAVSFGLADAALATENNVEKLSQLYQKEYQQLQILGVSEPQKRMVVAIDKHHYKSLKRALEIIEAMDTNNEGKLSLNLLGLDGWQRLPANAGRTTP